MAKSREKVVRLTPELLATLPPEQRAALESLIGQEEILEQRARNEKAKQDMEFAAGELLLAGAEPVLDLDSFESLERDVAYFPSSPLVLNLFKSLYGSFFVEPLFFPFGEEEECQGNYSNNNAVIVRHHLREHPLVRYYSFDELREALHEEETYIYLGTFWDPGTGFLSTKQTMQRTLSGFAVDIDRAQYKNQDQDQANIQYYMAMLLEGLNKTPYDLQPNYILLSGTSAQLWYIFDEPIYLQSKKSKRRIRYTELYRKLYEHFAKVLPRNACKVDVGCATINHAFRAPFTLSKYGFRTSLFKWKANERTNVLTLSDALGGDLGELDVKTITKDDYERIQAQKPPKFKPKENFATEKQLVFISHLVDRKALTEKEVKGADKWTYDQADRAIRRAIKRMHSWTQKNKNPFVETSHGHVIRKKPRHENLYYYTLERIKADTTPGNRYHAMYALAGVAYNCTIPDSTLRYDLEQLRDSSWGRKGGRDGKPITTDDVEKAMLGYTDLAVLRGRYKTEALFEWNYNPPAKRNHQDRWTHLQADEWVIDGKRKVNVCKENRELNPGGRPKGIGSKEQQIKAYAAAHPELSNRKIAEELGVSRNTVNKWLKKEGNDGA